MRNLFFLCLLAFSLPHTGHSQSNTINKLPNGVVVHQAQGVEGVVETEKNDTLNIRTMQDWNLAECMDALPHLEMKLNEAAGSDRTYYLREKELLLNRIDQLKSTR